MKSISKGKGARVNKRYTAGTHNLHKKQIEQRYIAATVSRLMRLGALQGTVSPQRRTNIPDFPVGGFVTTNTVTGRMSSSEPNRQSTPVGGRTGGQVARYAALYGASPFRIAQEVLRRDDVRVLHDSYQETVAGMQVPYELLAETAHIVSGHMRLMALQAARLGRLGPTPVVDSSAVVEREEDLATAPTYTRPPVNTHVSHMRAFPQLRAMFPERNESLFRSVAPAEAYREVVGDLRYLLGNDPVLTDTWLAPYTSSEAYGFLSHYRWPMRAGTMEQFLDSPQVFFNEILSRASCHGQDSLLSGDARAHEPAMRSHSLMRLTHPEIFRGVNLDAEGPLYRIGSLIGAEANAFFYNSLLQLRPHTDLGTLYDPNARFCASAATHLRVAPAHFLFHSHMRPTPQLLGAIRAVPNSVWQGMVDRLTDVPSQLPYSRPRVPGTPYATPSALTVPLRTIRTVIFRPKRGVFGRDVDVVVEGGRAMVVVRKPTDTPD